MCPVVYLIWTVASSVVDTQVTVLHVNSFKSNLLNQCIIESRLTLFSTFTVLSYCTVYNKLCV